MQDRLNCQEHPQEQLTTICICSHQCKKKLCPECQYESHRSSDGNLLLPQNTYKQQVLDALIQKEKTLKETCNEMENWNNLIKTLQQIFNKIIIDITTNRDSLFNKYQSQIQIIEEMKVKLKERSVFELNVQQIEKLSSFIQVTSTMIQNEFEQQRTEANAQKNRELIENKIRNLEKEIEITIKPLIYKTTEDDVLQSLKEPFFRIRRKSNLRVTTNNNNLQNTQQQIQQQTSNQLQKNDINIRKIRITPIQQINQMQDGKSLTPQKQIKSDQQSNYSLSPIRQSKQQITSNNNFFFTPNNNETLKQPITIQIQQPQQKRINNLLNSNNMYGFLKPNQQINQNKIQFISQVEQNKNKEQKIINHCTKIKIIEMSQETADQYLKNKK